MSFSSKNTTAQTTSGTTNQTSTNNSHNAFDNTTTMTRNPYAAAAPGLDMAAQSTTDWMNDPNAAAAYGGPRVAQMSDMTSEGIRGMFGGEGAAASSGYLKDVLGGKYLQADNPYLAQLTQSIRGQVMPSVNSQFSNAGMVGSTAHQGSLARGMTDALAQPLFAQYNNERGLQSQAAGMLPGIDAARSQQMVQAGQLGEGYDQRNLDAQRAMFEEAQQKRAQQLAMGTGLLGQIGQAGGTQTTNNSGYADSNNTATNVGSSTGQTNGTTSTNPGIGQTLLGGAMMAGSLYSGGAMGGMGGMFGSGNNGLPWAANPNARFV